MPFISENELERALVKAVKIPASAPDFYRLLLECDLLVMGTAEGREEATEQFSLGPGGKLNLVTGSKNGATFLPVFSSLLRMQKYVKRETKFLRINGRVLLELTRGAPVTLNPASEFGKEFTSQQIAQILGPSVSRAKPGMNIGEAEYPMQLVKALKEFFTTRPEIWTAWMVQVKFADRDAPHPMVGVETDSEAEGDWRSLVNAVQEATRKSLTADMVFDIQRIDRSRPTSMSDVLLEVPPFYRRRSAGPNTN